MTVLRSLIARHNIRAEVIGDAKDPSLGWDGSLDYRIRLKMHGRTMTLDFFTGSGWSREPNAEDVLDCLVSDTQGIDNSVSFEDWAETYGMDTDSRKAERLYRLTSQQAAKFRQFLGEHYDEFMNA